MTLPLPVELQLCVYQGKGGKVLRMMRLFLILMYIHYYAYGKSFTIRSLLECFAISLVVFHSRVTLPAHGKSDASGIELRA